MNVAPLPQDLFGAPAASDGTYVYSFGGYSFTTAQTLDVVYRYDPATNTWATMAPLPNREIVASAVYYPPTNKIYVFGGAQRDEAIVLDTTQIYDIASNTWSAGANLPLPRSQQAAGYNPGNGKIYLNGGYETSTIDSIQATTWEYDPVANTFTDKAPSPNMQGGTSSGIVNGHLLMSGGRTNPDATLDLTWDYDIATNTWQSRSNMLMPKNVPAGVIFNGKLYSIGGGNGAPPFDGMNDVVCFDPARRF